MQLDQLMMAGELGNKYLASSPTSGVTWTCVLQCLSCIPRHTEPQVPAVDPWLPSLAACHSLVSCPHFLTGLFGYHLPSYPLAWKSSSRPYLEPTSQTSSVRPNNGELSKYQKQHSQEDFLESKKIKIASLIPHCILLFKI